MLNLDDVVTAARRIAPYVRTTPVLAVPDGRWGADTVFKLEFTQHTGSFKARGAFNRILRAVELGTIGPGAGVIAASGGNAGIAVAYAARRLGFTAEIFVPRTAPAAKVAKLHQLGAKVAPVGQEYAEAYAQAVVRAEQTGALFCHAYDQEDVVAGQGTLALELLDQLDGFDTVVVSVGGGGLAAGITAGLDGRAGVVAVEPETIPTLHDALAAGGPVDVAVSGVAADSLGARRIGSIAYEIAVAHRVRSVLVTDESIVATRARLWQDCRLAVEHGAAAAPAALESGGYVPEPGERVVVVLCGANTDPATITAGG
ncbi:threonine/serine dehydratase [Catellatospora tritici]|uniref:threonine/serine dehydratase n=1 Tax=Catellatospora tritici TaxID=2851566 RepID=UPI001C2D1C8D|nr:threonine/serine dehydratase [Catellatospora tritici]MBV1855706.1 threonine/serine dehydratase [Catellatospora tritici]